MGGNLFLRSAARRRATLLGRVLRFIEGQGCARAPKLPPRKWNRALGLLRLRLHETAGRKTSQSELLFSRRSSRARSTTKPAGAERRGRQRESDGERETSRSISFAVVAVDGAELDSKSESTNAMHRKPLTMHTWSKIKRKSKIGNGRAAKAPFTRTHLRIMMRQFVS